MNALFLLLLTALPARAALRPNFDCLLERPLIVGASVSDRYSTPDPGTLLVRKHGVESRIVRKAVAHVPSPAILPLVTDPVLSSATLVIALDLFFWDSRAGDCAAAAQRVNAFVTRVKAAGKPLALGDIPITGGSCAEELSKVIAYECSLLPKCLLVGLRARSLEEKTKEPPPERPPVVMPDRLHPTRLGSAIIAADLEQGLSSPRFFCPGT